MVDTDFVDLPSPTTIRQRLEQVTKEDMQMFLKALYLTASSPIELAGELTSNDRQQGKYSQGIGPRGNDVFSAEIEMPDQRLDDVLEMLGKIRSKELDLEQAEKQLRRKIPVAVFRIKLSRKDVESVKLVALPMAKEFEPWTEQIYRYYTKRGNDLVFPFNRQDVWEYIYRKNNIFKGLKYTALMYTHKTPDQFRLRHPAHTLDFGMQMLRVVRTKELIEKYSFDMLDLTGFVGLAFRLTRMPIELDIPKTNDYWKRYIKKLCRT